MLVPTTRFPLEESPSQGGDSHHQVPPGEATILLWGHQHRCTGLEKVSWWCRGVAICDWPFLSPLILSKKNKKGVVCMGRLASPSLGYGFLLFLAGVAADSLACPDLASLFLLFFFFWKSFILTPRQKHRR